MCLADGYSCPANTTEMKLKNDQLGIYEYDQGCGEANTTDQTALLCK